MEKDVAFNRGSDARIRGDGMNANPYRKGAIGWSCWKLGWQDVDKFWGARLSDAQRAELRPLAKVS